MPVLLKVRGIGISKNELKMFSLAILYFPSFDQLKVEIYICIRYKLQLIHRLKANMIINNDVLGIENFLINLGTSLAHICSWSVDVHISIKYPPHLLNQKVLANTTTFVPPKFEVLVLFNQILLPDSRFFLSSSAATETYPLCSSCWSHNV